MIPHFILFVFFELEPFEVQGLIKIFSGDFAPIFNGMNLSNVGHLYDFIGELVPEESAGFFGVVVEVPLKLLLLVIFAVFVNRLNDS